MDTGISNYQWFNARTVPPFTRGAERLIKEEAGAIFIFHIKMSLSFFHFDLN